MKLKSLLVSLSVSTIVFNINILSVADVLNNSEIASESIETKDNNDTNKYELDNTVHFNIPKNFEHLEQNIKFFQEDISSKEKSNNLTIFSIDKETGETIEENTNWNSTQDNLDWYIENFAHQERINQEK